MFGKVFVSIGIASVAAAATCDCPPGVDGQPGVFNQASGGAVQCAFPAGSCVWDEVRLLSSLARVELPLTLPVTMCRFHCSRARFSIKLRAIVSSSSPQAPAARLPTELGHLGPSYIIFYASRARTTPRTQTLSALGPR